MRHIKLFEKFEVEEKVKTIEDYPQSVKSVYKKFNPTAQKSFNDNLEKFAKIAKKLYYCGKDWKEYFKDKKVSKLTTLNSVTSSLEEWMKKPTK